MRMTWGSSNPTCSLSLLRAVTLTSKECWLLTKLCQGSVTRKRNFCHCGQRTSLANGIPPGKKQFFLRRRRQWVSALVLELGFLWLSCWKCLLTPKNSKQWRNAWKIKAFATMNGMRQMWPRRLTSLPLGLVQGAKHLVQAGELSRMARASGCREEWKRSWQAAKHCAGQLGQLHCCRIQPGQQFRPGAAVRPVPRLSHPAQCYQDRLGKRSCQSPRPSCKAWGKNQPSFERQRHWIGEVGAERAEGDQDAEELLGCRRRPGAKGFQLPEHVGCSEGMGEQHPGIPHRSSFAMPSSEQAAA